MRPNRPGPEGSEDFETDAELQKQHTWLAFFHFYTDFTES